MTTVEQMIDWLQTLPPNAQVRSGTERRDNKYREWQFVMGDVDLSQCDAYPVTIIADGVDVDQITYVDIISV
jgi:hypothetical protein